MTTFLDASLRERWMDDGAGAETLSAARREYARRVAADDGSEVARSHVGRAAQRLSEALRLSGEFAQSLVFKDITLEIWAEQEKARAGFLVELQRGLVLAELGDERASAEMKRLREALDADPEMASFYEDFWFQYDARRCVLEGDRDLAAERLRQAVDFRAVSRAPRIVKWTQDALERLYSAREH